MKRLALVLAIAAAGVTVLVSGWQLNRWRESEEEKRLRQIHTLTGTVKQFPDFHSEVLGVERGVQVYLPPMYDAEPERRFPVLYMLDGQNVFDGATAYLAGREWEVDETAERLTEEGRIEPLIIVAVDNGGARRADEYTPTRVGNGGGEVDRFARMLVEELKPWVDETFRTRSGREDAGIAGSSYGALASLWIGLTHSDVFGKIAALSTSAGRDEKQIVGFVESLPEKPDTRVWTDMGTREYRGAVDDARALRDALVAKGWVEARDLRHFEAEGATHNEPAWAERFPAVLEFLFPALPSAPEESEASDD